VGETGEKIEIETEQIRVYIQRQPCRIACFDKNDHYFDCKFAPKG